MPEIAIPNMPHPPPMLPYNLPRIYLPIFLSVSYTRTKFPQDGNVYQAVLLLPAPQSLAWAWHTAGPRETVTEVLTFLGSENSAL